MPNNHEGTVRSPGRVREQLKQALDETGVTVLRHYVKRKNIAPDLRIVIDQLVQQAQADDAPEANTE